MTARAGLPVDLAPGSGRPASFRRATTAQLGMELRLTARRGENLFVMLVLPVVLLAFFAAVPILPAAGPTGTPGIVSLLPGVIATGVVAASFVNLGIATAFERGYGVLKRLGGTPLPRAGLLVAKAGSVAAVEFVQLILLVGVAVALGWSPGPTWNPALVVAAALLGTFAFASLGLLFAGTLRPEATLAVVNGLFVLGLLLGGLLVPAGQLPGALAALAGILPTAALAEALRAGLGAPGAGDALGPMGLLAGWGVAAAALAARSFRWE